MSDVQAGERGGVVDKLQCAHDTENYQRAVQALAEVAFR